MQPVYSPSGKDITFTLVNHSLIQHRKTREGALTNAPYTRSQSIALCLRYREINANNGHTPVHDVYRLKRYRLFTMSHVTLVFIVIVSTAPCA